MDIKTVKQRYGIIGSDPMLDQAINTAVQVAPINLSVLIIGESGTGKEVFSRIIHEYSSRKNGTLIAVNCGGIPEGTIDSELFGHEKGAFTGATTDRKGYFEMADKGTIFLDEIGELPLSTQAKLLRVLERGEYMKVGSSVIKKTDVRIVAATNVDLEKAISQGKFREDLFYRLNGIMLRIPPLRQRKQDIPALFHKFTSDFADANKMEPVLLTDGARQLLMSYQWPGNVRQLKNVADQVTVLKVNRIVDEKEIEKFIPRTTTDIAVMNEESGNHTYSNEREILFKVLFDMRKDVTDLKKLVVGLINGNGSVSQEDAQVIKRLDKADSGEVFAPQVQDYGQISSVQPHQYDFPHEAKPGHNAAIEQPAHITEVASEVVPSEEPVFSISDNEKGLIIKALEKFRGNRRKAAQELGISERTLYRKINDYDIDL